jgi:hypothetical protein
MAASYSTKILLAMNSGGKCAFENCRIPLSEKGTIVGEAAHIYGEKKGAARYKADMTDEQRDKYDNLIYICPRCHTIIDKQEQHYPAELLFEVKFKHEEWVAQQLDNGMSEITFAELEVAAKAIASGTQAMNSDFHVITPEEKIKKNNLTSSTRGLVSMGLSRSSEVSKYLSKQTQLDPDFPQRLKNGFKEKYGALKQEMSGDALFMAMFNFTKSGTTDFIQEAAGLAILCHLFELCEIFEK